MSSVQVVSGEAGTHTLAVPLAVFMVVVAAVHLGRALTVTPRRVGAWAAARSLVLDARSGELLGRHLRRKHLARAAATVLVGSLSVTLALLSKPSFSFFSLPVVLGVLVAQLLLPEARRGRVRAVLLAHRPSSYFAPRRALVLVRALFAAGVALGVAGVLVGGPDAEALTVHATVLLAGVLAMELTLRTLSRRGLPDRWDDMALECAVRVADARAVVAAGLVMSGIGLWISSLVLLRTGNHVVVIALGQLANLALPLLVIWAIVLTQPLRVWRPA